MNTLIRESPLRAVRAFYRTFIEPRSIDEDARRRELIFNVLATALFAVLCLLELSVAYADLAGIEKGGFDAFSFSLFIAFFGSLIALSRKGHSELASYLFLGIYFLAATWGEYAWGMSVPLALLSYGAIIVMTSILLGTRAGFIASGTVVATLVTLGYLETHGVIESDITWRFSQLEFKDAFEDSFVFGMIAIVSWLSNREIERSLRRARQSERDLKMERDFLEVKVEERTKELKAAELEKLSQLYRFVEFGRLSSGIFHDLLNPLSAISMSVEGLEAEGKSEASAYARECIDRAIKASKRMEAFIQTARKQLDSSERVQEFSADAEVSDAVDLLLHKSRVRGVDIAFDERQRAVIRGNPVKLFQIAVNLISNAIDSYDGVEEGRRKTVEVRLTRSSDSAVLSVSDFGSGIKPEIARQVFEPFFTTKDSRKRNDSGLGLGLSTTKEHVEKGFGGSIEMRPNAGNGTVFTVRIPLAGAQNHEIPAIKAAHTEVDRESS